MGELHQPVSPMATTIGHGRIAIAALAFLIGVAILTEPAAVADNKRLNDSVVQDVYTLHRQDGCAGGVKIDKRLQLAAQWHSDDVLNNRALEGDVGSDGSTPQDRAAAAGYRGKVSETVAVNPAMAISGIELINTWYYNPDYLAIMRNCANTDMGVWSENQLDRTVVVAVYGQPV